MKWYHYNYIESCKIHDDLYTQRAESVHWYHYIGALAVVCAVIYANMEAIK